MYLGWGRGGLLGDGSSVVELGEDLVPWSDPRGLDVCGDLVLFCFLRWRVLLLGAGAVVDAMDAFGGFTRHVDSRLLGFAPEFATWDDTTGLDVHG